MITTAILYLLYGGIYVITSPLRLLSDVSLPETFAGYIITANHYIMNIDFIFPVATFLECIAFLVIVEAGIIFYRIIMWVVKKIPTIS